MATPTPARYWRILIVTTGGHADVSASEIELRETAGGPDVSADAEVSASSYYPGHPAGAAADDNSATFWSSYGTAPHWIAFDLGSPRSIAQIAWRARTDADSNGPAQVPFELRVQRRASAADAWADAWTASGYVPWTAGEQRVFSAPAEVAPPVPAVPAYPAGLPRPLASKTRTQPAVFTMREPRRGTGYVQQTGTDVPAFWDLSWVLSTADAQRLQLWFRLTLQRGVLPFRMLLGTEFGDAEHTCQFLPDGLMDHSSQAGVHTYSARVMARKLLLPAGIEAAAPMILGLPDWSMWADALDRAVAVLPGA